MKLQKTYNPADFERDIYDLWEANGAFVANPDRKAERFSISMPPPNETGTLSIGHALFLTLQDIMARHARQQGKDVLWLPGTDHAALPVNALIEKQLADEGSDKHKVGREAFLNKTREFVAGSRGTMIEQMRAIGASADWTRQRYTLDEALNRSVNETFVRMYNDGLIYRGHRIVNWDPKLETTISDDELERIDEETTFYTFKYGPFEIGTARPETKFGDKYVVMHPDDDRYKNYKHGDTFEAEWINGPVTATVIKDEAVDPEFGTGVMTITPWHDHTDFEIAERHNLDKQQIIDFQGNLLDIAEEFAGMPIADARPKIVKKLKEKGLLVKVDKNYHHNIAVNERGKGLVEPQIKLQWFVDVNKKVVNWQGKKRSLKEVMQHVIRENMIEIVPSRFENTYFHWIDNLRDWCISRQIWWGHRIPAWYREGESGQDTYVGMTPPESSESDENSWSQDPDTLDTWFSSALWTWSTLIDPEIAKNKDLSLAQVLKMSKDFQAYHPTTVLETGWDILFFWVARMILMTTYMTGQVPFKTIYLHGMVRAEDGKKMSKSRPESIIDPIDIIDEYGADALRMALITSVSPGSDQSWNKSRVEANRNFCNKLWNIARFVEGILVGKNENQTKYEHTPITFADHWMLRELEHNTNTIAEHLANFRFSEAYGVMYHFVWDTFADWYIEASKHEINAGILRFGLESILKIVHPFAPFVTETIWQTLTWTGDSLLMLEPWPKISKYDDKKAQEFEEIKIIVTETRAIISTLKLRKTSLFYTDVPFLSDNSDLIAGLARIEGVHEVEDGKGLHLTTTSYNCWLDIDRETTLNYTKKLKKQLEEAENKRDGYKKRLANESYLKQAPKKLVDETKEQLIDTEKLIQNIEKEITRFTTTDE